MRGKYIAFSGLDGSGKTTQSKLLEDLLRAEGKDVVITKEPGSHLNGFNVRELLLSHRKINPVALELLFQADRAEHTAEVEKLLEKGKWIISDRSYLCGFCYGVACGHSAEMLSSLMRASIAVKPDVVFYLDLPSATERMERRGEALTREEAKGETFAQKVRKNYLDLPDILPVDLRPNSWLALDGTQDIATIHGDVLRAMIVLGIREP